MDTHPGEAITTTLQLVRAVIQPNQNDGQENQQEDARIDMDTRGEDGDTNVDECEQRQLSIKENPISSTSEDCTGYNSATTAEDNNEIHSDRDSEKLPCTAAYCNMSESESDAEQESVFMQRKKIVKREKTDSGIGGMEDMNLSNEEGSSSSNTNHSDSEITDTTDATDVMDIDLPPVSINKSYRNIYGSHSTSKNSTSSENEVITHYVDSNAFANYMKEKIQQLPLPFSVKLYINYNRKF